MYQAWLVSNRGHDETEEFESFHLASEWCWEQLKSIVNWGDRATVQVSKGGKMLVEISAYETCGQPGRERRASVNHDQP